MAGIDLKSLMSAMARTDTIITPIITEYLLQHLNSPTSRKSADLIADLLATPPRIRTRSFSASSAGQCDRAQVYGYLGQPGGQIDWQLANIFLDGRWRHLRWQSILLDTGALTNIEESLTWHKKRAVGTMDGIGIVSDTHPRATWRGKEFGFELKGVSTFLYAKLIKTGPKEEHLNQVARYFLMSGLELFSIVYEDKTTQAIHEWVIERDEERIEEQRLELDALNDAVEQQKLPARLPECNSKTGAYRQCGFGSESGTCFKVTGWEQI